MMDLERLVAALGAADVVGRAPVEVRDLAYDARTVVPGSLFFCVPGAVADGHDFAPDAVKRGAVALVVERPLGLGVPELVVSSSRAAMAQASRDLRYWIALPHAPDFQTASHVDYSHVDSFVLQDRVEQPLQVLAEDEPFG